MLLQKFPAEMFGCWRELRLCVLTSSGISRNIIYAQSRMYFKLVKYMSGLFWGRNIVKSDSANMKVALQQTGSVCLMIQRNFSRTVSLSLSLSCLRPGADLKSKVSPNLLHSILLHSCYYKGANRRHLTG